MGIAGASAVCGGNHIGRHSTDVYFSVVGRWASAAKAADAGEGARATQNRYKGAGQECAGLRLR